MTICPSPPPLGLKEKKNLWTTCLKNSKNLVSTNQPPDGRPTLLHSTIRILPTFILGPDIY